MMWRGLSVVLSLAVLSGVEGFATVSLSSNALMLGKFFSRLHAASSVTEDSVTTNKDKLIVPTRGIINYIGKTSSELNWTTAQMSGLPLEYSPPTSLQLFLTRFNLWRQWPWKKFKGKAILKAKLSGSLPLESPPTSIFDAGNRDPDVINSLAELTNLFNFAAYDPRVTAVYIELGSLTCGYAKLQEVIRMMKYFRSSGKKIIGYAVGVSEKEYYVSRAFDEFYIPPDGVLDLRGFSASAQFLRGVFSKIGVEPQVQRIGKYKSFGDTYQRESMSDSQREVLSSILTEASNFWVKNIALSLNTTEESVRKLWSDTGVKTAYDFKKLNMVDGVIYLDQLSERITEKYSVKSKRVSSKNETSTYNNATLYEDFDLTREFEVNPRRIYHPFNDTFANTTTNGNANDKNNNKKYKKVPSVLPVQKYLRKMRAGNKILQGLQYRETSYGSRVAVINAIGAIVDGKSGNSPLGGNSVGSESIIRLIQRAKMERDVKAVVLRVDSPGGSALASDLVWKELRSLATKKPVVASMVDVAASGGYYFSMACDQICAEELTLTGSIGVVLAKFNTAEVNQKIGLNVDTLSIGRYAEVKLSFSPYVLTLSLAGFILTTPLVCQNKNKLLSTTKGFNSEEQTQFEDLAKKAYGSFVAKAAASRSMNVSDMEEVAQGRVWTGKQASERGLVRNYL